MGSPIPPPPPHHHHHGFGGASPRDLHSPFSENSGRYSDNYGPYSDIHYADRPASRTPSFRTTSSSGSNSNKNHLYYLFQRGEESWNGCRRYEVSASQDEIKRKSKSKSKTGNVVDQLDKMGKPRRDQIEGLIAGLNASETDGSTWEPVFIENTKSKPKGNTLVVTEFSIIFQRRTPRPEASRRQSKTAERSFVHETPAQTPIFAKKGTKASVKDEYLYSPFANNPLFNAHGQPMDANGPVPFTTGMPGNIPFERPMAQMLPKIHTQPSPDTTTAAAKKPRARNLPDSSLDLEAALEDAHGGDPDGIIVVGEEQPSRQARPAPKARRHGSAQRSSDGGRYSHVNIETRHPEFYTSNRSSIASDEGSILYGELDELSSRTSDDTHSSHRSPVRKTHRTFGHARHTSGQHSPGSPRYHGDDTRVVLERTRRPRTTDAQNALFGAIEQIPPRRSAHKPMVIQTKLPPAQPDAAIPPTAEYPSFFDEQDKARYADTYIHEAQREQQKARAYEAELAQREREVERQRREFEDKKNPAPTQVNVATGGRKRYNYEPRDIYGH